MVILIASIVEFIIALIIFIKILDKTKKEAYMKGFLDGMDASIDFVNSVTDSNYVSEDVMKGGR